MRRWPKLKKRFINTSWSYVLNSSKKSRKRVRISLHPHLSGVHTVRAACMREDARRDRCKRKAGITSSWNEAIAPVPNVGTGFFPLDKRWDLPSMALLPHAQMSLTRLATLAPFEEAKASLDELLGVHVSASLARRACLQAGRASVQVQNEQANPQAQVREEPPAQQMVMSTDGAGVALTSGEWGEIKLFSPGEVGGRAETDGEVHTIKISHFA